MGDVLGITEADGNFIAQYLYDDWGKLIAIDTADEDGSTAYREIAEANPLRYRGYYYDSETGYYYLQSRYYDASICRFINADSLSIALATKNTAKSINAYKYCYNDPVNNMDIFGFIAIVDDVAFAVFLYSVLGAVVDFLTSVLIGGLLALFSVIIYSVVESISVPSTATKTKTFSDVKAKTQSGKHYKIAYVNDKGELIRLGKKLTFTETLTALGLTATTNEVTKRYNFIYKQSKVSSDTKKAYDYGVWGIYADSQASAKALATVLGNPSNPPEVHGDGQYIHYHDGNHIIHIWYGSPFYY